MRNSSCVLADLDRRAQISWNECSNLARSANLPTGLYILLALISYFFYFFLNMSKAISVSTGPIFTIFHQMEGICVNFLDQVQFFRFLKGRCHGNQFCIVSKTQTMWDFCNFYTIWKRFGCRWLIWNAFEFHKFDFSWLFGNHFYTSCENLVRFVFFTPEF